MTRDLTTAMDAAIAASHVDFAFLYEGLFDSGAVRLFSGLGSLIHDGETYVGAGDLIALGEMSESSDLRSDQSTISLSGIPANLMSIALSEDYQGRAVSVKMVLFDSAGAEIGDAVPIMVGAADQMKIDVDSRTMTIALTVETEAALFERAANRRYTQADLEKDYPDDKGFEFAAEMEHFDIEWFD